MIDRVTGLSRQIGFVRFESPQVAQTVIDEMNGFRLAPAAPPLIIKFADTKEQKDARQTMRSRGRGGRHQGGMPHGAVPAGAMPPMYYYYPQYGAAAFGYPQGYPFASNPAAAAGYNAGAYPYAAMASALGYAPGFPGAPGSPLSPMSVDGFVPQSPQSDAIKTPDNESQQASLRTFNGQQVQFTANAANVNK